MMSSARINVIFAGQQENAYSNVDSAELFCACFPNKMPKFDATFGLRFRSDLICPFWLKM